jgi:hypothetical protein
MKSVNNITVIIMIMIELLKKDSTIIRFTGISSVKTILTENNIIKEVNNNLSFSLFASSIVLKNLEMVKNKVDKITKKGKYCMKPNLLGKE